MTFFDVGYSGSFSPQTNLILQKWGVQVKIISEQKDADLLLSKKIVYDKLPLIMHVTASNIQKVLEEKKVWGITGLEMVAEHDGRSQRHSTFNRFLARTAAKQKKIMVFFISDILKLNRDQKAVILGRLSQNIVLCAKYKVNWHLWSGARTPFEWTSPKERRALASVLGASSEQALASVSTPSILF